MMAQYHHQHELPEIALVSKGIMATLFQDVQGPRFCSAVEVALLHVAVCPILLHAEERKVMQMLGNALSPLQALLSLTRALKVVRPTSMRLDLTKVVEHCLTQGLSWPDWVEPTSSSAVGSLSSRVGQFVELTPTRLVLALGASQCYFLNGSGFFTRAAIRAVEALESEGFDGWPHVHEWTSLQGRELNLPLDFWGVVVCSTRPLPDCDPTVRLTMQDVQLLSAQVFSGEVAIHAQEQSVLANKLAFPYHVYRALGLGSPPPRSDIPYA